MCQLTQPLHTGQEEHANAMKPSKEFMTHKTSRFNSADHEGGRGPLRLFAARFLWASNIVGQTSPGHARMGTATSCSTKL